MSYLLKNLTKATEDLNEQEIINNLKTLLAQEVNIKISNADVLYALLKIDKNEILLLTAELIAELAKFEQNRKQLTNEDIINKLMLLLDTKDNEVIFNIVRALGNICFENEEACNIINKQGIHIFLEILKKNPEDSPLLTKALGLLVNLFTLHEGLMKSALKNDLISTLEQLLHKYANLLNKHPSLLTILLTVLNSVENYLDEMNIPFTEGLCQDVINIFKASTIPEISVIAVEIFHGQCEKDEIKMLLAREGVCELLFELIEKYRHKVDDEDSRSILKMACDLIVVILTGDDCMYLLYNDGQGKLYKNMITWLDMSEPDLLSTGVLAIGNFARKDKHCIQMVENGIAKKLINILSKYNTSTDIADVKIQHALLSTLKNLVIPKENKGLVLKEGLIEVIYPMIKIDQFLVIFKLLGTFRMVIDGQESAALDLISRKDFIERLVYWCYNSDHLGVRGEVPRLLAWLIKHCHSTKPYEGLLDVEDSVKCIVEMISSNHAVMQNEAFYALTLLCASNDKEKINSKLMDVLVDANVGKNLNFVLTKYSEKMDRCTIDNLTCLLEQIVKSAVVCDHLKASNILAPLNKLSSNLDVDNSANKLKEIMSQLSN
ncbi:unnamed protein product [Phaedon cochleariae]|uniref:Rap1 GTPase-GDP dissociation stimulator 1-B n=1 Tax=Phaedon cochleariae TaxID=80249 RepID=A0A9N9X1S3_PHACE|nr:unnamed protein product [Phaedon cochleariae]